MQNMMNRIPKRYVPDLHSNVSSIGKVSGFGGKKRTKKYDGLDGQSASLEQVQQKLISAKHSSAGDMLMIYTQLVFDHHSSGEGYV